MKSCGLHGRTLAGAVLAVTCALLGTSFAEDAGNRGLLDSSIQTLVGGNIGDGNTNALTAPLTNLQGGVVRDAAGNTYFTEGNRILKLTPAGVLSAYAGSQTSGYSEVA